MDFYLAQIMFFAGNFAPRGFALCQGQMMGISQNTALFSLLGVVYGGDGQSTFQLPNAGGRTIVGTGQAPGVSHNYQLGEVGGAEQTTITSAQMPMHVHALTPGQANAAVQAVTDNTSGSTTNAPEAGARLGVTFADGGGEGPAIYVPAGSGNTVNLAGSVSGSTSMAGGSQPLSIMQPYLGLNVLIVTEGLYPSRP